MPPNQPEDTDAKRALVAVLEARLDTAMGIRLSVLGRIPSLRDPIPLAAAWFLLYASAAAVTLWWSTGGALPHGGHAKLVSFMTWSGFAFAATIALARLTTAYAIDLVRRDILPFASDQYAAVVAEVLDRERRSLDLQAAPWVAASAATVAMLWATAIEIAPLWWTASPFPLDLLFWAAASFYIYFWTTRMIVAATFPRAFAVALDDDRDSLYLLGAVDSPLILGFSRLNRAILVFWSMIFLLVLSGLLLVLPGKPFGLVPGSPFLFVLVPISAFFSLGLGTLIYLGGEAVIGTALRRYILKRVEPLQREINALLQGPGRDDEASEAKAERLVQLHDRIIAGGRYGSRLATGVSLALPLAMPAIGLIDRLLN